LEERKRLLADERAADDKMGQTIQEGMEIADPMILKIPACCHL